MTNSHSHETMLELCKGVQDEKDVKGWKTLLEFDNFSKNKNFDARAYQQGKTVVIALAGIDPGSIDDVRNARVARHTNNIPSQYGEAQRMYEQVKNSPKYKDADIRFTGYSLGGTVANLLSHHTGKPSIAFAPTGGKQVAKANPKHFKYDDSNIKTYGVKDDPFFNRVLDKQSGTVYVVDSLPTNPDLSGLQQNNFVHPHLLRNYSSKLFEGAKKVDTSKSAVNTPADISSLVDNSIQTLIAGRVYTSEEMGAMSSGEFQKAENDINEQLKNGVAYTNKQADEQVKTGGLIWVKEYLRDDGTKVEGHYRAR